MKKQITKVLAGTLAVAMVASTAVATSSTTASAKTKVTKVTVTSPAGKTAYVAKGKKISLTTTVKVKPNKKANKKVTYKSANKKIATVSSKGVVKGVKAGTTKITVTSAKNKKKKATIKVVVKKAAVKKVKLSAKTVKLTIGAKKTLKATVTPTKNVYKKVKWSTSKKKVATVSSKGVVTAKAAGTATITAKAVDGSKKKATCKVTVAAAKTNLKSAQVQNGRTVAFTLDKATALDASKVVIKKKELANGTYQTTLKVDDVATTDKINYTVTLNNRTPVYEEEFVQVGVPSLTGTKTVETQYKESVTAYTSEEISAWTVDEYGTDSFGFWCEGYSSYSIENLPAGLTAEEENGSLKVKGVPTTAGVTTATLKATDEVGNTQTKSIYFIIGSEKQIAGAGMPKYVLENLENSTSDNVSAAVWFTGGSGRYVYTLEDKGGIDDAKLSESDYSYDDEDYGYDAASRRCVYVYANVKKAGDYTVKVKATDKKDSSISFVASVPIHVEKAITVTGTVKDANGNGITMNGASVVLTNKDKASRYAGSYYDYDWYYADAARKEYTDEDGDTYIGVDTSSDSYKAALKSFKNGVYKVRIPAGTYDVTVSYDSANDYSGAVVNQYKQTFSSETSNYDFTLPLYKVTITGNSDQGISPWYKTWSIQKGEYLSVWQNADAKQGDADYNTAWVYLKAGTYALETSKFESNWKSTTTYTDSTGKTYTSEPSLPSNAWFDGYSYTKTSSETYDMCKLTANVTVGSAAVTVAAAKTTVETGKKDSGDTYKYVYEGLKNAKETLVEADKAFDVSDYNSRYNYDEDTDVVTWTYSYDSKSVFVPTAEGVYKISTPYLYFYDETGKKVTANTDGNYELKANTKYIVAEGTVCGDYYGGVTITEVTADQSSDNGDQTNTDDANGDSDAQESVE